jgi:hypothetical protein
MSRHRIRAAFGLVSLTLSGFLFAASSFAQSVVPSAPDANPGRPTISTPANLVPLGYLQFETGFLGAADSGELSSRYGLNEVMKLTIAPRLELLAGSEPMVHWVNGERGSNGAGDVLLGFQAIVLSGEMVKPTIAVSYVHRAYSGDAPDLDSGSTVNSGIVLLSEDVEGFHLDVNAMFNEAVEGASRRAQFGQTLSVSHDLVGNFSLSGEVSRFTQPFLHGNAVQNLWAFGYKARNTLVLDIGFSRGLTKTSTQWQAFAGFTYLIPKKLL